MHSASAYTTARRLLALYVRGLVSDWTRRDLAAVSADRITAPGVATAAGGPGRDLLLQGARIVYAGGETARQSHPPSSGTQQPSKLVATEVAGADTTPWTAATQTLQATEENGPRSPCTRPPRTTGKRHPPGAPQEERGSMRRLRYARGRPWSPAQSRARPGNLPTATAAENRAVEELIQRPDTQVVDELVAQLVGGSVEVFLRLYPDEGEARAPDPAVRPGADARRRQPARVPDAEGQADSHVDVPEAAPVARGRRCAARLPVVVPG